MKTRLGILWSLALSVPAALLFSHHTSPGVLEACTAFALHSSGSTWVGKNLDWEVGDGIAVVNERDVEKFAWNPEGRSEFSWVSRFGSVTFNQFGWGFPLGGINEAGLVVEELSYSPGTYPTPDHRAELNELQWVQYQLDNSASVQDVLASDTLVRIQQFLSGLHYLVADKTGATAVIEFLNGKRVVHTGEGLSVPVLANDTYENSVRYLGHHVGFGGTRVVSDGPESPERFVRAATLLKEFGEENAPTSAQNTLEALPPQQYSFHILDSVKQSDTQWTVVYDLAAGEVSFKTASLPVIRSISLDTLDFSCRPDDLALPLSRDTPQAREGSGSYWTVAMNKQLLELVFSRLGEALSPDELPSQKVQEDLAGYSSTTRCAR